jgi:hypothetical protein
MYVLDYNIDDDPLIHAPNLTDVPSANISVTSTGTCFYTCLGINHPGRLPTSYLHLFPAIHPRPWHALSYRHGGKVGRTNNLLSCAIIELYTLLPPWCLASTYNEAAAYLVTAVGGWRRKVQGSLTPINHYLAVGSNQLLTDIEFSGWQLISEFR